MAKALDAQCFGRSLSKSSQKGCTTDLAESEARKGAEGFTSNSSRTPCTTVADRMAFAPSILK